MSSVTRPAFHLFVATVCLVSFLSIDASSNIFGQCINEEKLFNCSGIGLFSPPSGSEIPQYKEVIDISYNKISNITFLDYGALSDNLLVLNLSKNVIHILNNDAFKLLTSLQVLDLSGNLITGDHLLENNFCGLNKLQTLNMSNNPIKHLKTNLFNFMELGSITYLDLSHSHISTIEASSLDLPSLVRLDLSWNNLKTFEENFFKMLVDLKYLDLSYNQIVTLNEIPYMPALVTLVLDFNHIQKIQVSARMDYYADKLENLYLRNNDVVFFNATSLPLESEVLQVVDLSNNKLQCDCHMRWIRDEKYNFKEKSYTFPCNYPKSLKGKELLTIDQDALTCGYSLVVILSSVAIICVFLTVSGLVAFFSVRRCRRRRLQKKMDRGGNYTAVYTRDDEDVQVSMRDDKQLLEKEQEFDV